MTNEIKRFKTDARMSQVVIAAGVVYLSGQIADTAHAPFEQQVTEILARIDTLLALGGVDKTRLLTANVWLSDARDFAEFNRLWEAWVPKDAAPTRATVHSALVLPGLGIEIAVTALAS